MRSFMPFALVILGAVHARAAEPTTTIVNGEVLSIKDGGQLRLLVYGGNQLDLVVDTDSLVEGGPAPQALQWRPGDRVTVAVESVGREHRVLSIAADRPVAAEAAVAMTPPPPPTQPPTLPGQETPTTPPPTTEERARAAEEAGPTVGPTVGLPVKT